MIGVRPSTDLKKKLCKKRSSWKSLFEIFGDTIFQQSYAT